MKNNENYSDNKSNSNIELAQEGYTRTPAVDIYDNANEIVVISDMPGVKKENVDINFEDNILSIIGWQNDVNFKDYENIHDEYKKGVFKRSFNILTEIDIEKIKAKVKDGILTISLPKHEKTKPKKITVEAE